MSEDETVNEVRRIRDEYAKSLNYPLRAIYEDLKEKERRSGRQYVSRPPRKPGADVSSPCFHLARR